MKGASRTSLLQQGRQQRGAQAFEGGQGSAPNGLHAEVTLRVLLPTPPNTHTQ